MALGLGALPFDILRPILDDLIVEDWSRLMRLNKSFHANIETQLMANDEARHRFMRAACRKGYVQAVRKALSYGAEASLVNVRRPPRRPSGQQHGPIMKQKPILIPTLQLAAAGDHNEVFQLLLDNGAQLGHQDADPKSIKRLHQRLFNPSHPELLLLCLKACRKEEIYAFQDHVDKALLDGMRQDLDIEGIKVWVGLGSDPRTLYDKFDPERPREESFHMRTLFPHFESALSLGMARGDNDVLDVFLASGFDIASTRAATKASIKRHHAVLLYTAVISMLRDRTSKMVDLCLGLGIDLNLDIKKTLWRYPPPSHPWYTRYPPPPKRGTAIEIYLENVDFSRGKQEDKLSASEGLLHLLRQGAGDEVGGDSNPWHCVLPERFFTKTPRNQVLLHDEKYTMIKMLISEGGDSPLASQFLSRFFRGGCTPAGQLSQEELKTIALRWDDLMDLLLEKDTCKQNENRLSVLLRSFCQWLIEHQSINRKGAGISQSILDPLIIRKLLKRGAAFDGFKSLANGDEALLSARIADYYVETAFTLHPSIDEDCMICERSASIVDFVETVMRLGASPNVPDEQGRTFYSVIASCVDDPCNEGAHFDVLRDLLRCLSGSKRPEKHRWIWNPISDWAFEEVWV